MPPSAWQIKGLKCQGVRGSRKSRDGTQKDTGSKGGGGLAKHIKQTNKTKNKKTTTVERGRPQHGKEWKEKGVLAVMSP